MDEHELFSPEHLKELLGDLSSPRFPAGSIFARYDCRIPLAQIPLPEGGCIFLAFDRPIPRPFPSGSFIREADYLTEAEFRKACIDLLARTPHDRLDSIPTARNQQ